MKPNGREMLKLEETWVMGGKNYKEMEKSECRIYMEERERKTCWMDKFFYASTESRDRFWFFRRERKKKVKRFHLPLTCEMWARVKQEKE